MAAFLCVKFAKNSSILLSCVFEYWYFLFQVVSPFPPSDKIGIKSVQREVEEIVPMKEMKMDWVPYIPLEKRYLKQHFFAIDFEVVFCTVSLYSS